MAAPFISALDARTVAWAAGSTLVAALVGGWKGVIAAGVALAAGFGLRRLAESRLNMVNGDVIGGVCELSEVCVLVVACIHT
jgi:cobalamin synthase